jgi:hypothetical protein
MVFAGFDCTQMTRLAILVVNPLLLVGEFSFKQLKISAEEANDTCLILSFTMSFTLQCCKYFRSYQ